MKDRRMEPRLLCADLVKLTWREASGRQKELIANLEDISRSGACLQTEIAIPPGTAVEIQHRSGTLAGRVRYCIYRDIGYFLGVQFEGSSRWSEQEYRPSHLLDPRQLVEKASASASPPEDSPEKLS